MTEAEAAPALAEGGPLGDAQRAYKDAVERAEAIKEFWEAEGSPITGIGSSGQIVAHPLLKAIQEAELTAAKLRESFLRKHSGPEPSAVVKPLDGPRITRRAKGSPTAVD